MSTDEKNERMNVFISYSHSHSNKDSMKLIERLAEDLDTTGIRCWFDKSDVTIGEKWEQELKNELAKASVCLVILTAHADATRPKLSKEWSAMQECAWRREDLALCSMNLAEAEIPPFLRKWRCLNVNKASTSWDDIVARTVVLLKKTRAETACRKDEKEPTEATERFAELRQVLNAVKVGGSSDAE
jgi:hypothetical protein